MLLCFCKSHTDAGIGFQSFGQITPRSLVLIASGAKTLTANVLLVNLPQLLLSFLYVGISGIMSSMLSAYELAQYSLYRKALRVSQPSGSQRSTYYLSIPFRYAIPITGLMALLHWTTSESIFLVSIVNYYANGTPHPGSHAPRTGCGWSPAALLMSLIIGGLIILGLLGLGFLKYPRGMPLLSTCSLAISAACHRSGLEGPEIATMPLMYGEIEDSTDCGARRAGFSARPVKSLKVGAAYAND